MSPDAAARVDGTIQAHLLSGFQNVSSSPHDCDVILVPISTFADYRFNPKLRDIKKPWVLLDFLEYEWCFDMQNHCTHLFGLNTRECRWLSPAWWDLCDFVRDNPPALYLKRELLAQDVSDTVKPVDWPCSLGELPLQTEDAFNSRSIEVFHCFGFSHPSRPRLHSDIFRAMTTHGIGVISELDHFQGYFQNPSARTWASIYSPWYARKPIHDILWFQERSKMSVSLPGCGKKCFRMAEAPVHTIMALPWDDLAWSYEWADGENCIRLDSTHLFDDLDEATKRADLFKIYVRSQETIALYRTEAYAANYLTPLIAARL